MNIEGKTIYETPKEILNPKHTALVVWDVQNALVSAIFNKSEFVPELDRLIKSARKAKVPIFYTKITPLPFRYESSPRLYSTMKRMGVSDARKASFMAPGSPESEIYKDIAPAEGDVVINKNTADIFVGTNFEMMARNAGIETIVFAGISTEVGIESSARSAANRGFYAVVAEDCVSSRDKELHEASLKVMRTQMMVMKREEISRNWE